MTNLYSGVLNRLRLPAVTAAVVLALLLPQNTDAQTKEPTHSTQSVVTINAYAKQIDRFIKSKPRVRIFGDVSSPTEDEKSKWQEFKSIAKLEEDDTYQSAKIWLRQQKVACANLSASSPSGDWAQFIWYYFREDGSLAKIHAELNTFHGNVSIHRDQYFDSSGDLIRSTQRFLDLKTQKPRKTADFMDQPFTVFRKVTDLPFYTLL